MGITADMESQKLLEESGPVKLKVFYQNDIHDQEDKIKTVNKEL